MENEDYAKASNPFSVSISVGNALFVWSYLPNPAIVRFFISKQLWWVLVWFHDSSPDSVAVC